MMAEINKLLASMVGNGVNRAVLPGGAPMEAWREGRRVQGKVFESAALLGLLTEIVPPEESGRVQEGAAFQFSFTHTIACEGQDNHFRIDAWRAGTDVRLTIMRLLPRAAPAASGPPAKPAKVELARVELMHQFAAHRGRIFGLSVAPGGARVATAGEDHKIKMWDAASGRLPWEHAQASQVSAGRRLRERFNELKGFYSVAHSPDGRFLAAGDTSEFYLFDAATGQLKARHRIVSLKEGGVPQLVLDVAFSPDGKRIVTSTIPNVLLTSQGENAANAVGAGLALVSLASGDVLGAVLGGGAATPSGRGLLMAWNGLTGAFQETYPVWKGSSALETENPGLTCAAFSPDGRALVCGDSRQAVHVLNLNPSEGSVWNKNLLGKQPPKVERSLACEGNAQALRWVGDDSRLAILTQSALQVADVQSGRPLWRKPGRFLALQVLAGGQQILAFAGDSIHLFDAADGSAQLLPFDPGGALACAAFSAEGQALACASGTGQVTTWKIHYALGAGL